MTEIEIENITQRLGETLAKIRREVLAYLPLTVLCAAVEK